MKELTYLADGYIFGVLINKLNFTNECLYPVC